MWLTHYQVRREDLALFIQTDYRDYIYSRFRDQQAEQIINAAAYFNAGGLFFTLMNVTEMEYFPELHEAFKLD